MPPLFSLPKWGPAALTSGSAGGSQVSTYSYDEAGRRTQVQTPLGGSTSFVYDHLGRLVQDTKVIDGSTNAVTSYEYTLGGKRTLVTDANGTDTTWIYDSFGREVSVTYAVETSPVKTSTTARSYDTYGRLETVTDAMGAVKTYNYDVAGRNTRVDINKSASGLQGPDRLTYAYDAMDRVEEGKTQSLLEGQYANLTLVARTYDGFGQLKAETQSGNHRVSYQYDTAGNLQHIGYPSGSPITAVDYAADVLGRVTAVQRTLSAAVEGGSGQSETTAALNYEGYRETRRLQSLFDLERTEGWDSFRRPTALRYEKDSTNVLLTGLTNTWDADGRITVRERAHDFDGTYAWGEVYRYDQMGRMTQMWRDVRNPQSYATTNPSPSDSYADQVQWNLGRVYERNNVVTTPKGGAAVTQDYTNNVGYQYTHIGSVQPNLTWDGNGQMTSRGTTSYAWTALGQLAAVTMSGQAIRNYTFDAFGRRVSTKVGSAETQYLYHGWHMIGAYELSNSQWLWQEIPMSRGEGMLEHVALDTSDLDGDSNTTEYRSYAVQEDWQDTVWALSNSSGVVIERYVQDDPFGKTHTEDANGQNLGDFASQVYHGKRMHGGVTEEATSLYDFRNRWYAPMSGGWLSRDPLGLVDSENLYQMVYAGPMFQTDIFGWKCGKYSCIPMSCPCQQVKNDLVQQMKGGKGASGKGAPLVDLLSRASVQCADCTRTGLCAESGGTLNNPVITICYGRDLIGWEGTKATYGLCKPCCPSVSCRKLILHEWAHLACALANSMKLGGKMPCRQDVGGQDPKDLTKIGEKLLRCITSPSPRCLRDALRDLRKWNNR